MAYLLKGVSRISRHIRVCSTFPHHLVYSAEVLRAKEEGRPIVALESTIITHGMPYPQNLETAIQVEDIIKERGATPATIAILKGQLTVGLTEEQLAYLAQAKGVVKASRRDLAPVAAAKLDGATTVAGTIIASELADIPVFVTGGIGGVHRQGEVTLDVSADLNELGRSKTLVVCSGVKSILDIGRTLEYLETQGVCVCAFGESDEFPAFYTVRSGHRAPHRVPSAHHAAQLLLASRSMKLASGIVVAVPVPREYAMDEKVIEDAIETALEEANKKGIRGKEVTPFILAAVAKATGGASLETNIALIKNNAKVGADIAVQFQMLKNVENSENSSIGVSKGSARLSNDCVRRFHTSCIPLRCGSVNEFPMIGSDANSDGDVLVIGGANVDRTYRVSEDRVQHLYIIIISADGFPLLASPKEEENDRFCAALIQPFTRPLYRLDGSTHASTMDQCGGGVGRNMAEALWRLRGGRARLLTAVGDDADGQFLTDIAPGLLLDGCIVRGARTPTYAAVLDRRGECLLGLGDMALHNHISTNLVDKHIEVLEKAPLVVVDGNIPQTTMDHVLQLCHQLKKPVFFEPTDRRKATIPFSSKHRLSFASPNLAELRAMAFYLNPNLAINSKTDLDEILALSKIVLQVVDHLIVTLGATGVITITQKESEMVEGRLYPVEIINKVENVSGAGDCFASGFIHGILSGFKESNCVSIGFESAKSALLSKLTVPSQLQLSNSTTETKYKILTKK